MTYIAGRNAVLEALRAGRRVRRLLMDNALRSGDPTVRELLQIAAAAKVPVDRVPRKQLDGVNPRHQGVAAEVDDFAYTAWAQLRAEARAEGAAALLLVLDEVQDP